METSRGFSFSYFTRPRRSDTELVREYLGDGPMGREAARQCDEIRELRDRRRRDEAATLAHLAAAEQATDEYCRFVELALHAYMAECGYHYHRGEWRKRRVPKQKQEPVEHQQVKAPAKAPKPKRSLPNCPPARRPAPTCKPLDCRCPLVRGVVCRRLMVQRSPARQRLVRRWVRRRLPRRRITGEIRRPVRRWRPRSLRTRQVGQGNDPRPPPAVWDRPCVI